MPLGTRCCMWVPPEEKDPVVLHAPTRKSVACFGAVGLRTGILVTGFEPKFNAESFQRFLVSLLKHRSRGKRLVLVLDNAKYHHARALQPWLNQYRNWLTLLFLPPYSPELNPIERVWKLTRRLATHNRHFPALDDIMYAVGERFRVWEKPNRQLARLCAIT
ncbi:MAG: IS630 family transposase [Rhodoplanes sp.]